jgi:hypothetical protein
MTFVHGTSYDVLYDHISFQCITYLRALLLDILPHILLGVPILFFFSPTCSHLRMNICRLIFRCLYCGLLYPYNKLWIKMSSLCLEGMVNCTLLPRVANVAIETKINEYANHGSLCRFDIVVVVA